ncbi:MAG: hypothetical protein RMK29_13110 [Myxococcales bacterium]|nr:hypothetical protein [Myxococcales bacterium]
MRPAPGALLVVLLCGSGCGPEERARMPAQQEAFAVVRQELGRLFAEEMLHEPDVRWWTEPCPGTQISAVVLGPRCYAGLYYRPGGVDVAWRGSIGQSAYAHELMHYFLDQAGLGSDPGHARTAYWQLVERIDLQLQQQGL